MISNTDYHFLSKALSLARYGGTAVKPNPSVGAVIVKNGRILADGYHPYFGGPHAEAVALQKAGSEAKEATLYCNLEPCSFDAPDKHNEPCTKKIIRSGISRVVIAQMDPNRNVRGQGIEQLRKAGIKVELAENNSYQKSSIVKDAWYTNAFFNTVHALNRAFVTIKLAQSLDGKIATALGDSKWITDEKARAEVHRLRRQHDAVLVGVGTVCADNPRLTVRIPEPQTVQPDKSAKKPDASQTAAGNDTAAINQPTAIVLDPFAKIPADSYLVKNRAENLIVYTAEEDEIRRHPENGLAAFQSRKAVLRAYGVTVQGIPLIDDGQLSLQSILQNLKEKGLYSVLIEGGAKTATNFLRQQLFDALRIYISPMLIGGDGRGIGSLGVEHISDALQLERIHTKTIGRQAVVSGFRKSWIEEVMNSIKEEQYVYGAC